MNVKILELFILKFQLGIMRYALGPRHARLLLVFVPKRNLLAQTLSTHCCSHVRGTD